MNVLLATLPVAVVLVYASKLPLALAMSKEGKGYDNKNPRDQAGRLEGWGRRAMGAHANGFEAFPPFAAGVLVAHVTGAHPTWAVALAVTHLVARLIYPALYIANIDRVRSPVWAIGTASSLGLLLLPFI